MIRYFVLLLCIASSVAHSAQTKVLAFAGSTRTDSVNKKLILEAVRIATEEGGDVEFIDLKDYPIGFYDADLEAEQGMPENARILRRKVIASQLILIASPEYNSSLTALLKNTLDWLSRSEVGTSSREAFRHKDFIIMSAAPGPKGGSRGLVHLRAILEDIGGTVNPHVFVVANAYSAFDAEGRLKQESACTELKNLIKSALK